MPDSLSFHRTHSNWIFPSRRYPGWPVTYHSLKLASFVGDNQAWDEDAIWSARARYSLAPVRDSWRFLLYSFNCVLQTFREVERAWTGDEALNQDLLHSLGGSTCADLIMVSPYRAMRLHGNILLDSIAIVSRTAHRLLWSSRWKPNNLECGRWGPFEHYTDWSW